MDKVMDEGFKTPRQLAGLSGNPGCVGLRGAASEVDASGVEFYGKQNIHCLEPGGFNGEEVTSEHLILIV